MLPNLDPAVCYRALETRDRRFDGHFFTGVRTTGIFCRPVCPATTPKLVNCTFYRSAAAAQQAGYRPCLRCRPELSPQLWPMTGGADIIPRALRLIGAGALDEISVAELAAQLGVSDRYLRRRFAETLGTSPAQVAKTRRLLFAKQLISETTLTMTEIAIAAGFKSIRSFNYAIQQTYGCAPTQLRRHRQSPQPSAPITLKLSFSLPYDWPAIAAFLAARATPGLTSVTAQRYCRSIELEGHQGWVAVSPVPGEPYLQVQIGFPKIKLLSKIIDRLRSLFDLNTHSAAIEQHLRQDPLFQQQFQPGVRIPGAWDAFELAVRAIVGQQVSVTAANTLFARLVAHYGEPLATPQAPPALTYVFPKPEILAAADLTELGMTGPRANAISVLAQTLVDHPHFFSQLTTLDNAVSTLCQLPGIGPWTAHYIAMRALQDPDAFPPGDVALLRGMAALGEPVSQTQLLDRADNWRPWRAYAAMHLWAASSQPQIAVTDLEILKMEALSA
ncbi:MAG: AlkA N-terminal domain-containing protein [Cyanobacteria bacterium P01_D01_bin.44]